MKAMEPAVPLHRPMRMFRQISVLLALCLTLVPCLRADDQSEAEVTSILTTGAWRVMDGGRMITRVFKADGTFSSASIPMFGGGNIQAPPAYQPDGQWKIGNGKIILMFANGRDLQQIDLPINPRFARMINQDGQPMMMMRMPGPQGMPGQLNQPIPQVPQSTPVPTPVPSPPPVASADDQQSAAHVVQAYHDSLVFVSGNEGSGSGFIATIGKGAFLVTNCHVVAEIHDAAFKTLDGSIVQGGAASAAVGEDIFCMQLPQGGRPFEIMQGVDTNAAIGDSVVVLGNAEGAGVVNTIVGKIVGIGPNLVEVDAPFVPGNSGSPIVHLKTGKVIGVATYTVTNKYDLTTDQKLKDPIIRRFGYRLNSVKAWQPVNWSAFNAQSAQMHNIESLTADLYDFFRDLGEHQGRVTPGRATNPIIKNRINDWLEAKGHNHSITDQQEADENLISFLKVACQSDVSAAQRQISYDYFQRDLADQQQSRAQMEKAFEEILKVVQ